MIECYLAWCGIGFHYVFLWKMILWVLNSEKLKSAVVDHYLLDEFNCCFCVNATAKNMFGYYFQTYNNNLCDVYLVPSFFFFSIFSPHTRSAYSFIANARATWLKKKITDNDIGLFVLQALTYALKIFNYFFTAVFILECVMKMLALGIQLYVKDKYVYIYSYKCNICTRE